MLNQVDEQRHPKSKISVGLLIEKWFEVAELEDTTRERYEGLNRNTSSLSSALPSSPSLTRSY